VYPRTSRAASEVDSIAPSTTTAKLTHRAAPHSDDMVLRSGECTEGSLWRELISSECTIDPSITCNQLSRLHADVLNFSCNDTAQRIQAAIASVSQTWTRGIDCLAACSAAVPRQRLATQTPLTVAPHSAWARSIQPWIVSSSLSETASEQSLSATRDKLSTPFCVKHVKLSYRQPGGPLPQPTLSPGQQVMSWSVRSKFHQKSHP
jgi:hypothetical protein